jgi:hypothetical protein
MQEEESKTGVAHDELLGFLMIVNCPSSRAKIIVGALGSVQGAPPALITANE